MVPSVFYKKYLYQLSPDTFCVLARFYKCHLENHKIKEIIINSATFKKEILCNIEYDRINWVWTELTQQKLLNIFYKHNIYELNISQINLDSEPRIDKNEKFRIIVKDGLIKRKELKPEIPKYVENFISRFDPKLQNKLKTLVEGAIQYLIRTKNKISFNDTQKLLLPFVKVSDDIIEKVCDIYNNKISHYGKVHYQYIHGILRNLEQGKNLKVVQKQFDSNEKYKKEFEEGQKRLALKIVTGKIQDNVPYQAFLRLKDFDGLRKLHKIGCEILAEQNKQNEIFKDYDWLKND